MQAQAIRNLTLAIASTLLWTTGAMAQDAPAPTPGQGDDAGQVAFNTHCRNCHSTDEGDNRLGPSLHNIVGAKGSSVEGFNGYSGALKNITWDEATLDKFLANPSSIAPSTTMKPFGGVPDDEQRKLIIEFLKTKS